MLNQAIKVALGVPEASLGSDRVEATLARMHPQPQDCQNRIAEVRTEVVVGGSYPMTVAAGARGIKAEGQIAQWES